MPSPAVASHVSGIAWPALPGEVGQLMLGLQYQLGRSQWWPRAALEALQFRQLRSLVAHALAEVPYYREVLTAAGIQAGTAFGWDEWRRIPILRRRDLQNHFGRLEAARYPRHHGTKAVKTTGGSTGTPVRAVLTEWTQMIWEAITLRDSLWHRRELGGTMATLRAQAPGPATKDGLRAPSWNHGIGAAFANGPSLWFSGMAAAAEQIDWLKQTRPDYLLAPPMVMRELLRETERRGVRLEGLKAALTFGEPVPAGLRERVAACWQAPLEDTYSCEEAGYLALQCPDFAHYHVQSEAVLLEIVDDSGQACAPGAIGRVVVTPLHNFAMPLIRYELGDLAEAGAPCPCGRGLPVLARILGRTRSLLRFASGVGRRLNLVPLEKRAAALPIRQYQLIQRSYDTIELNLVVERRLTASEEAGLEATIAGECGATGFAIACVYRESIPRSPSGKYEEFMCAVAEPS